MNGSVAVSALLCSPIITRENRPCADHLQAKSMDCFDMYTL